MKGIVLAAGKGTRLYPMTKPVCKPLLPVYDKPLIYYPIAILMQAGISDIMVIVPPGETDTFRALLGDGSQYGLQITYAEQPVARGIADALLIGREFVGADHVCLVLGDNIFYAPSLGATLKQAAAGRSGATVFGYWVEDPAPSAWWSSTRAAGPSPLRRSPATPSPTTSSPASTSMTTRSWRSPGT